MFFIKCLKKNYYICYMKEVFILRSVPGAGKSTLAKTLVHGIKRSAICEADSYLYNEQNEYVWSDKRAWYAHKKCYQKYELALKMGLNRIVVSNTNVESKDVNRYSKLAKEFGYTVYVIVIENRHDGKDSHNVSVEKKKDMAERIKNNLKLL